MKHVVHIYSKNDIELVYALASFYKQFLMHNKEQNIAQIFSLTCFRLYLIACSRENNVVIFVSHGRYDIDLNVCHDLYPRLHVFVQG